MRWCRYFRWSSSAAACPSRAFPRPTRNGFFRPRLSLSQRDACQYLLSQSNERVWRLQGTHPRSISPVSDSFVLCRRYMLGVEIAGQMGDLPKDIKETNGEHLHDLRPHNLLGRKGASGLVRTGRPSLAARPTSSLIARTDDRGVQKSRRLWRASKRSSPAAWTAA